MALTAIIIFVQPISPIFIIDPFIFVLEAFVSVLLPEFRLSLVVALGLCDKLKNIFAGMGWFVSGLKRCMVGMLLEGGPVDCVDSDWRLVSVIGKFKGRAELHFSIKNLITGLFTKRITSLLNKRITSLLNKKMNT